MEQYTDDERVEDLKKWWKENGASIIAGIALGLIAIFGWQYWTSHRNAQAEQASQAYDTFVVAAEKPDAADQARQQGQALLVEFPKSPYAALTALRLAKVALDGGDAAGATQRLEWVIDNAKLDEIKDIARLRLARVLLATGRTADAEQQLARVATTSLTAEREELRGDLALAGNDAAKARTAYEAARAAGSGNPLLQLKLDNLAPPNAESLVVAPSASPPGVESESTQSPSAIEPAATTKPAPEAATQPGMKPVSPTEPAPTTDPTAASASDSSTDPTPAPPAAPTTGQ